MESPNYAKWIPEAGGYVHNGSVVSTTPLYDDVGRQKVDVDLASLSIAPPSAGIQPTGNVDTYDYTKGVGGAFAKANQSGSGEDVNSDLTKAGSLGTLNSNTENPDLGVLNTPATKSSNTQEPILNPVDQTLKDLEYMVAHNNLKGQIDQYVKLGELTGEDYTQKVNSLWKQRGEKVRSQDDAYLQQMHQALQAGDYDTYNQLVQEQQAWRDNVGYSDQINRDYEVKQQELQINYENMYLKTLNDIAYDVLSLMNDVVNFRYDPSTDMALNVAQGYAVGAVKEQMNATGMYYSSMTQSAITKAVAELVPVYEKMAKDELKENISLLMNVGNYLMNLEQDQFNLWKGQVEMQYEANNEKRKQIAQAIETANARGYYNNEEAILLGVPAGTESSEARARAQAKQDEIDKELRQAQIQMTLADHNQTLALEKMYLENEYKKDYWNYQAANPKPTATSTSGNNRTRLGGTYKADDLIDYYNDLKDAGYDDATIDQALLGSAYSIEDYNRATSRINSGNTDSISGSKKHDLTDAEFLKKIQETSYDKKPSELIEDIVKEYKNEPKKIDYFISSAKYPKDDDQDLSQKSIFNSALYGQMGPEAYKSYVDFEYDAERDETSMTSDTKNLITELDNKLATKLITDEQYDAVINQINEKVLPIVIQNNANDYGSNSGKTNDATNRTRKVIDAYAENLANSSLPSKDSRIVGAYKSLMDSIINAGDDYDYSWYWFNQGDQSKKDAVADIIKNVRNNPVFGKDKNNVVYNNLINYANSTVGDIKDSWFYE